MVRNHPGRPSCILGRMNILQLEVTYVYNAQVVTQDLECCGDPDVNINFCRFYGKAEVEGEGQQLLLVIPAGSLVAIKNKKIIPR